MREMHGSGSRLTRIAAAAAIAVGLGVGSYGIAAAASGTNSTGTDTTAQSTPDSSHPWGGQRSDETPLTGDALAKVTAAAKAEVPNATIVRVETDADGHAAYEAHIVKADGTAATVYVDKQYEVVSVETR